MSNDKPQYDLPTEGDSTDFISELTGLLNKYSKENASDTPDYILATYLVNALKAWNLGVTMRDKWYNFKPFAELESLTTVTDLRLDDSETKEES